MTNQQTPAKLRAPTTAEEVKTFFGIVGAVTKAIRDAKELPSGHLYAICMSKMDLQAYERMISLIVGSGLVQKRGDILRWVGPEVTE